MIGAIAGDIIGSRFEGHPSPPADFELFHAHCRFADDTVCSLAVADALMRKADFAQVLRDYVRRHPDRGYGGMFNVSAAGTVPPALTATFDAGGWEEAVRTVMHLGGDTDTLACIAGAVAEAIHGVPDEIADQARTHLTGDLRLVLDRFDERLARRAA